MEYYEIILESHINKKRSIDFFNMEFEYLSSGQTVIKGNLRDQSELFSLLTKIRDLNIKIILIKKGDENE